MLIWFLLGIGMFLFGAYHLIRHIRLEMKRKREADENYKEYNDFVNKNF